jgi:hypothetical protein
VGFPVRNLDEEDLGREERAEVTKPVKVRRAGGQGYAATFRPSDWSSIKVRGQEEMHSWQPKAKRRGFLEPWMRLTSIAKSKLKGK